MLRLRALMMGLPVIAVIAVMGAAAAAAAAAARLRPTTAEAVSEEWWEISWKGCVRVREPNQR
jgi:hypothetical protein